jgi:hypothetical protein
LLKKYLILACLDGSNPVPHNTCTLAPFWDRVESAAISEPDFAYRRAPASAREVAMSEKADCRIEVEAAAALIHWKSLFAEEVAARARRLAADSGRPGHVTLAHYRQAAQGAVAALAAATGDRGPSGDAHQTA